MQKLNRWFYQGGKPNGTARVLNRISAWIYKLGFTPPLMDTLEVIGRKSGTPVEMPVVVVQMNTARYLVSMLGGNTNWVKNVRAAHGQATLLKGGRTPVSLVELPAAERAPILKRYCQIAPSGRSHIPVAEDAPLQEFEAIAHRHPVFRIDLCQ